MKYRVPHKRRGFTLIEMMVAMTLTIFIMTILSQAFIQSLETFSGLKAIGDMQANLRAAAQILRNDLAQDHFTGKRRLSDPNFSSTPNPEGFMYFGTNNLLAPEGMDTDGMSSGRYNDRLRFTVKKRGNKREAFFSAPCSHTSFMNTVARFGMPKDSVFGDEFSTVFTSQWADIDYFLVATGSTAEPGVAGSTLGTPLFALYRRELLLVADNTAVNNQYSSSDASYFTNIAYKINANNKLDFLSPSDLNNPANGTAVTRSGTDAATLLLPNVLSFQVQTLTSPSGDFGTATTYPIYGVSITIRVWDIRSQQARQTTIIQEL